MSCFNWHASVCYFSSFIFSLLLAFFYIFTIIFTRSRYLKLTFVYLVNPCYDSKLRLQFFYDLTKYEFKQYLHTFFSQVPTNPLLEPIVKISFISNWMQLLLMIILYIMQQKNANNLKPFACHFYERNNNETIPGAFAGGCPVIKLSYRQGSERKQKKMTYI